MTQDMDLRTTAEDGTRSAEALITQDFVRDPHATYDWMREEGPVRLRQQSGSVLWMLTRYEDARAALAEPKLHKDPRRFPNPAAWHRHGAGGARHGAAVAAHAQQ